MRALMFFHRTTRREKHGTVGTLVRTIAHMLVPFMHIIIMQPRHLLFAVLARIDRQPFVDTGVGPQMLAKIILPRKYFPANLTFIIIGSGPITTGLTQMAVQMIFPGKYCITMLAHPRFVFFKLNKLIA